MTRREYWERRLGEEQHFGTAAIARYCRASQRTAQRWIREGRLPALRSSRTHRFHGRVSREDFIDFLVSRTPLLEYPSVVRRQHDLDL